MKRAAALIVTIFIALLAAGCSGGGDDATSAPPTQGATTETAEAGAAALERAARSAVEENHRLSVYVLWHNRVPDWANESTRGPALAALRDAAADRKRQGIRVKLVSDDFQILSIRLDPSYERATAVARGRQRVRPHDLNGEPQGRAVELDERAQLELRRLEGTDRFVVWSVEVLP